VFPSLMWAVDPTWTKHPLATETPFGWANHFEYPQEYAKFIRIVSGAVFCTRMPGGLVHRDLMQVNINRQESDENPISSACSANSHECIACSMEEGRAGYRLKEVAGKPLEATSVTCLENVLALGWEWFYARRTRSTEDMVNVLEYLFFFGWVLSTGLEEHILGPCHDNYTFVQFLFFFIDFSLKT